MPGPAAMNVRVPKRKLKPMLEDVFADKTEKAGRQLAAAEITRRAAALEWLLFDVDGVLTDGLVWYTAEGETLKPFHVHDGLAMKLAQRAGLKVGFFTGRTSEPLHRRARDLGLDHVISASRDKAADLETFLKEKKVRVEQIGFVGDDVPDLPVLRRCGLAMTPLDGVVEAKAAAHLVLPRRGGAGVARAAIELVLGARGDWQRLIAELFGG